MDKNKAHSYGTRRNKAASVKVNDENVNVLPEAMSKRKLIESPSAAKLCVISGYASPPCRPVALSQNNENEIEWDLTSPSARKYHVLLSDKKTSTPNQTPTRKRELRPRIALCKKNIAHSVDRSGDLINELAALNELVNSEQANNVMTPPRSVKTLTGSDSPLLIHKDSPKLSDNSTSEIFDDDSFFSESLLLCTQAIEQEALGERKREEKTSSPTVSNSSSIGMNVSRKSFELDFVDQGETVEPSITMNTKVLEHKLAVKHPTSVKHISSRHLNTCQSLLNTSPMKSRFSQNQNLKPVVKNVYNVSSRDSTQFTKPPAPPPKQPSPASLSRTSNQSKKPFKSPPQSLNCGSTLGITRLYDPQTNKKSVQTNSYNQMGNALPVLPPAPKNSCGSQSSNDLFDDDDDDLLIAVANEVESQFASSTYSVKPTMNDDDDDGFFQPEVLDFISQIETQAISTQKSTAELLEEKRQAAIQRRQQRLNRH